MGTVLFVFGVVISMIVFCIFIAFMIWAFLNIDSIVIKVIMVIIAIAIPIVLIVAGLNLGVEISV